LWSLCARHRGRNLSTRHQKLVAELLEARGHKIARNQIVLDRPIKAIGLQDVKIALHPEVSVTIHVNVARSPEEAELQAQGVDVMAQMFEKDVAGFTEVRDPDAEPGEIASEEPAAEAPEAAPAAEAPAEAEASEGDETTAEA
jgi:large subunit ribosomal protein L9